MSEAMRLAPYRGDTRNAEILDLVKTQGGFDRDLWTVMEQRDNALIASEILNGAGSSKFVYKFSMGSTEVTGISVVGARQLAYHYGGIEHRLIAAVQKTDALFQYTSYPSKHTKMQVSAENIPALAGTPDFYKCVVEVTDAKQANVKQDEKSEFRFEQRRDGSWFERPNYEIIAQSKAYRNAVLALIPQDVQIAWKIEMLKLRKEEVITGSVLEEKRGAVLRFAAAKQVNINRRALEALMMEQISGLSDAARGGLEQFLASASALGLLAAELKSVSMAASPAAEKAAKPGTAKPPPATKAPEPQVDRSPDPPPAGEAATGTAPAGKVASAAPAEDDFEAYLCDEYGEPQRDASSNPIVYVDPDRWARALEHAMSTAKNPEALLEQNSDAFEDAASRGKAAADILNTLRPSPDEPLLVELVKTRSGSINVSGYKTALSARASRVTAGEMLDFAAANRPTIMGLPQTARLQCVSIIQARANQLNIALPQYGAVDAPAAAGGENATSAVDRERARADEFKAELDRCANENDLRLFAGGDLVKAVLSRWDRDHPELAAEIRRHAEERLAAVAKRGG